MFNTFVMRPLKLRQINMYEQSINVTQPPIKKGKCVDLDAFSNFKTLMTCLHNQEVWVVDVELHGVEEVLQTARLSNMAVDEILVSPTNHNLNR